MSKNTIDLRQCREGDILISKHGLILEYVTTTPWGHYRYLDHVVKYKKDENGNSVNRVNYGTRTHEGFTFKNNRKESDHDIVKVIRLKDRIKEFLDND